MSSNYDDDVGGIIHNIIHNSSNQNNNTTRRKQRRLAKRAKHRLHSINRDATNLQSRVFTIIEDNNNNHNDLLLLQKQQQLLVKKKWPWLANKNCGSWYLPPPSLHNKAEAALLLPEVYFKSTDGHGNSVSLKRLNLSLLQLLSSTTTTTTTTGGGCFLVDSSMRKLLPDSLSRTIPLWCCVMNRLALKYRIEMKNTTLSSSSSSTITNNDEDNNDDWDIQLYTPSILISNKEHTIMLNTVDDHVDVLYNSGAIVNINQFIYNIMIRPIRPIWTTNGLVLHDTVTPTTATTTAEMTDKFSIIVCCNPSYYHEKEEKEEELHDYYYYSPGAGDDDATWANNLTPQLFWSNSCILLDVKATEDEIDDRIISIVNTWTQQQQQQQQQYSRNNDSNNVEEDNYHDNNDNVCGCSTTTTTTTAANENNHYANRIGNTNIWIGSRTSGRSPQCWMEYDIILNVTMDEYPTMKQSIIDEMVVRQRQQQQQQEQQLSLQNEKGEENKKESSYCHGCTYSSSTSSLSSNSNCYYLQLPIKEGKKDKIELEHWLSVGMTYLLYHVQQDPTRRILIHCAQGRDRSVAVCIAFVVLFCVRGESSSSLSSSSSLTYPLQLNEEFINTLSLDDILDDDNENNNDRLYDASGLKQSLVDRLLSEDGRDLFLLWLHKQKHKQLCSSDITATTANMTYIMPFATKESLRNTLHLIQQDRTIADTTRSTMQKLNRYFMSSPIYKFIKCNK